MDSTFIGAKFEIFGLRIVYHDVEDTNVWYDMIQKNKKFQLPALEPYSRCFSAKNN